MADRDASVVRAMAAGADKEDAAHAPLQHAVAPDASDASSSSVPIAAAQASSSASDEREQHERKKDEARVLSQLLLLFCAKRTDSEASDDASRALEREYAVAQHFVRMPRASQAKIAQSLFVLQPSLVDDFAPVLQFFLRLAMAAHAESHASSPQTSAARPCTWSRIGHVSCIERTAAAPESGDATTTAFRFPPAFLACVVEQYGSVQRSKCEEVWHGDHMAYRCRTCGLSDSSCMCLACFDPDDHDGHDYRVYRCSSGGCCDCGDPLAWKPEGFCKKHRSGNARDATAASGLILSALERDVVTLLVRCTVGFCVNVLREVYAFCLRPGGAYDREALDAMRALPKTGRRRHCFPLVLQVYLDRVALALAWLQLLATSCVAYRDVVASVFLEPLPSDFDLDAPGPAPPMAPTGPLGPLGPERSATGAPSDNRPPAAERAPLRTLDVFLRAGVLLPVETCDVLGVLYLKLLFDQVFKQQYTCHFVTAYPFFVRLYLQASDENNDEGMRTLSRFIDRLFCQLFHSTAQLQELERVFAARSGDLEPLATAASLSSPTCHAASCIEELMLFLLDKLNGLFASAVSTDANLPVVVDCGRTVFKKRIYARLCSDLRTLLVHPQVAADALVHSFERVDGRLVLVRPSVYASLIETFALLQQMDLQTRHETQHIEYESQHWTSAFVVDYEVNLLLSAFLASVSLVFTQGSSDASITAGLDPMALATALLAPVQARLLSWTHESGWPKAPLPPTAAEDSATLPQTLEELIAAYDASATAVQRLAPVRKSFHLPLHHLYASLLHALCVAVQPQRPLEWKALVVNSAVASIETPQDEHSQERADLALGLSLAALPLRVCVFTREVKAGLWVRNGNAMWQQLTHYYSKHWRFFGVHADLYLCQVGALVAPRGAFTRSLLHHTPFDRTQSIALTLARSGGESDGDDPRIRTARQELDVLEEMLRLVVQVALAPVKTATAVAPVASLTALLERELMHWLSLGPCARSEVLARVDMKLVEHVKQLPAHPWHALEEEEILAHVLERVGVYDEPAGGSAAIAMGSSAGHGLHLGLTTTGSWKLQPALWAKISPYFECFTPSEAQQCEQNVRATQRSGAAAPSALTVPILPDLPREAVVIHAVLAAQLFHSRDLLAALFVIVLNWTRRDWHQRRGEVAMRGDTASENLLVVALQVVYVAVQLLDAPDEEADRIALEANASFRTTSETPPVGSGASIDDVAAHFVDSASFFANVCVAVPLATATSTDVSSTTLIALLRDLSTDDAPLEADVKALVRQIFAAANAKSRVCRSAIVAMTLSGAVGSSSSATGASDSNGGNSGDDDATQIDGSSARDQSAKERMRLRQQHILAQMQAKQLQFLSSHGEAAASSTTDGARLDGNSDAESSSSSDFDHDDDHESGDDEEEDEWGFPTGQVDVQLYLEHVSSAIAQRCEKEKRLHDRRRRHFRRSSRSFSSSSGDVRMTRRSSSSSVSGDLWLTGHDDDGDDAADECGLCRMPCERQSFESAASFGFVGMVQPTIVPHKLREMAIFATPPLPAVQVRRSRARDDEPATVSLALSDASVWSCGHALHHDCLTSYLATLWQPKRPTDILQNDDRLLSERDVEFQCPICRRLSNCLVPNIPRLSSTWPRAASGRALDRPDADVESADVRESLVFATWLSAQMSFQDDRPPVLRRKSRTMSFVLARLHSSAAERERLSTVERTLKRFFHDITRRSLRAALQLPLLMTDETIQDERQVETEIQDAAAALDAQLPTCQLFVQCLAVQVDLLAHERALVGTTDAVDKQRMQSLRHLADVAVAASALSAQHELAWRAIDAPRDGKFDVVVTKLNATLFGHRVLFEDDDDDDEDTTSSAQDQLHAFCAAQPVLCHPDLFAFFVARMVWRQSTPATSPSVVVDALVSEAFFLARVLVTAQLLQALCCLCLQQDGDRDDASGDVDMASPDSGENKDAAADSGDFSDVQSLRDAHRRMARLLARCRLTRTANAPAKWSSRVEEDVSALCLPLLQRITLLMDVLLPSAAVAQGDADDPCAVCDGVFGASADGGGATADRPHTRELETHLRRLHLPPLRRFFHAQMFSLDQRALCQLWAAQLEAKAAVLRQRSTLSSAHTLFGSLVQRCAVRVPALSPPSPPVRTRLLLSLPRIYMTLFIAYNDKPRGVCLQCKQLPQHPAICLYCGVVVCCFSPCCESKRGNVGECSQHAQTCGLGVGAFLLLRACTVVLFLGNERRCVWGSVYVDKNGEEDPYLRRGKTLYLDESRVLALESLLVSHSFAQNTAILTNTSRRDGRRY